MGGPTPPAPLLHLSARGPFPLLSRMPLVDTVSNTHSWRLNQRTL